MKHSSSIPFILLSCLAPFAAQAGRPLMPEDWYRFQTVSHLSVAPDGAAVAYLVTSYDKGSDESRDALWTVDWSGTHGMQLTHGESVSEPRFSPDGRYLSFLSARPASAATQLWVLDRRGGKPRQISHVKGEIVSYAWSPDAKRVVLVMRARENSGAPKPLVIDAYHFKEDGEGYLTAQWRSHLYLLDVASGACDAITSDPERVDSLPQFSPDGRQIAYVSNHTRDPRSAGIDEVYLVAASRDAKPTRLLSTWSPNEQHIQWSPDGTLIAFLQGDELKYNAYIMDQLAVAQVNSARVRVLTGKLDREVSSPIFAADGRSIQFSVEDDGLQYPAQVVLASGAIERLGGPMVVHEISSAKDHTAVLVSGDRSPPEVYALENKRLRPLSAHNRALFAELSLGTLEDISFKSRDGTEIHGQMVKPPDFVKDRRYPTILWIHGGPNLQDDHSLELAGYAPPLERQLFASHGYVVLAINYRGGTGRGLQFTRSMFADWGDKEVADVLAGVDYAIASGVADPARLGIGGWSYGGILTDDCIASDARFKAAISGAGSASQISMYGADEYILQYDAELGPPWRNPALWLKVSYPFFHADRIHTPTLFMGGDNDFDVPISGGEQMYQALRTLGVETELIVYPGETHIFLRPSYLVDRFQRYLGWMDRYLKPTP